MLGCRRNLRKRRAPAFLGATFQSESFGLTFCPAASISEIGVPERMPEVLTHGGFSQPVEELTIISTG